MGLNQQDANNAYRQQQFGLESRKTDIDEKRVDAQTKQFEAELE